MIRVPGAPWLRLQFDDVVLPGSPGLGDAAYLMITSSLDGGYQTLNRIHTWQWQNTSAYFNGDEVEVAIYAYPGTGPCRLAMSEVTAGLWSGTPDSQCGPVDDRVQSFDPRNARALPIGCTAWMINDCNHCFLTAGHCTAGSGITVVEFNVPLSNSNGSLNHPGPEDQYATDPASTQSNGGQGVGNDWAYFGVFPNSVTGLTPFDAQGDAYDLALPGPAQNQIRITGYGTNGTLPANLNQVQKTHVGPFVTSNGTTIQYQTDTTGGNSGSPIVYEPTGEAIGIHTHGGCSTSNPPTGQNSGTGSNHTALQAALNNPQGLCAMCPGLRFSYPGGRPDPVNPDGGSAFEVIVEANGGFMPQPGTGLLHYDVGAGFQSISMQQNAPNEYTARFPMLPCGVQVRYYVSAEATTGERFTDPRTAPADVFSALVASGIVTLFEDNFETDTGWTVVNQNLTTGAWVRAVPIAPTRAQEPPGDFDGSGRCFVTGNTASEDVDGGPTILTSPVLDLSGQVDARIGYARWRASNSTDPFTVEVSNNNGGNWTLVETVTTDSLWELTSFTLSDFVAPSAQVRVRFSISDFPNDSVTEGGLDAFSVRTIVCGSCEPCDVNCDGVVDAFDIEPFVVLLTGGGQPCSACAGDANGDGVVDAFDIEPFVGCLTP
jgi:V8-like Glu-specific endopeptidase